MRCCELPRSRLLAAAARTWRMWTKKMAAMTAPTAPTTTIASFQPPKDSDFPEEVEALVGSDSELFAFDSALVSVLLSSDLIGESGSSPDS